MKPATNHIRETLAFILTQMRQQILYLALLALGTIVNAQVNTVVKNSGDTLENVFNLTSYDSIIHEKIYRVWIDNYQIVEISKARTGEVSGKLVSYITKLYRKESNNRYVYEILTIPRSQAKKVLISFENQQFEKLRDCREIEGYVIGADGMSYIFETVSANKKRSPFYWSPMSNYHEENISPDLANVKEIISIIDDKINPWFHFKNLTNKVGPGKYTYGMIIMEKY